MSKINLNEIAAGVAKKEENTFSGFATSNSLAHRKKIEKEERIRPPFAIDRDRIMYSGAFRRYTGKTQVVYFASLLDEQLTSRSLHTISVAQIAKTIGRFLSLNTDLIDAIALGHDLGHPPFGHDGEVFLSEVSQKYGMGFFHHNIQSLRSVDKIANKGLGLNLSFQTRDGIISHNGEVNDQSLEPDKHKSEKDIADYIKIMENGNIIDTKPGTLEGCVVRITDTIAYIGQDIEDAIRIGLITREDLPEDATKVLGNSNGQIIETLVNDVVTQSYNKNFVAFSGKISEALFHLKKFNYAKIYKSEQLKINHTKIKRGFKILYEFYLHALKEKDKENEIFVHFLNSKKDKYVSANRPEIIVRDFIAGMTDRYFTHVLSDHILPELTKFDSN
ncbi:MAG: HD domain-containing protein [Calditrichaeota bacterium]|nr:MAG: HD domain-containing protein [Calditrichota bacterium]MBL1207455.1 HD domain-containing protein [Calditrichota bacterium]NOG47287.1 HD domain-containing protein [Calditrichota bacterium]